jgi:hypothetical protein
MDYLKPKREGRKVHYSEMGLPLCRNTSIPLDQYELVSAEPQGEVCSVCKTQSAMGLDRNDVRLERPDVLCRCCGHVNTGGEKLDFGFYCQRCGEYWRFSSRLSPLPPFREDQPDLAPWL